MDQDELRQRLADILCVEERQPADWAEVERLALNLQSELLIDATPEVVHRYLDDVDLRCRDDAYRMRQRREVRRYVDHGEYDDGKPVPWWGCVLALLAGAGLVGSLLI